MSDVVLSPTRTLTIANNTAITTTPLQFLDSAGFVDLWVSADGWTSASLGIQVSNDNVTYTPVIGSFVITFTATGLYKIENVPPFRYIKLWSNNGSGSSTNQGGARTLTVTVVRHD